MAKLADKILAMYYTGIPTCIWGDPGLGKSAITEFVASKLNVPIEVIISSTREPSDFLGLPLLNSDRSGVNYVPPHWVHKFKDNSGGIVFFDEISTCTPNIQAALLRIVNEGWVGEYKLPETCYRMAAGNYTNIEGCEQISMALANRFTHIFHKYDHNQFAQDLEYGFNYDLDNIRNNRSNKDKFIVLKDKYQKIVAGFLKNNSKEYGYRLPKDPNKLEDYAYPTPRSWTNVVNIMATLDGSDKNLISELVVGTVGTFAGNEFLKQLNSNSIMYRKYILTEHLNDYKDTFDPNELSYDENLTIIVEMIALAKNNSNHVDMANYLFDKFLNNGYKGLLESRYNELSKVIDSNLMSKINNSNNNDNKNNSSNNNQYSTSSSSVDDFKSIIDEFLKKK